MDEIQRILADLEARINARLEHHRLAELAAAALDERIISNMAERLVFETEMVLKEAAGE